MDLETVVGADVQRVRDRVGGGGGACVWRKTGAVVSTSAALLDMSAYPWFRLRSTAVAMATSAKEWRRRRRRRGWGGGRGRSFLAITANVFQWDSLLRATWFSFLFFCLLHGK